MESEYRKGYVYIQNHFAGIIAETEEGYSFTYDRKYLKREDKAAVSLTLPLREEPYRTTILFPFFDGLIPEGWLLGGGSSRNWKINQNDRFGLFVGCLQRLYWRCLYQGRNKMKCLCCGKTITAHASESEKKWQWHSKCVKKFFSNRRNACSGYNKRSVGITCKMKL